MKLHNLAVLTLRPYAVLPIQVEISPRRHEGTKISAGRNRSQRNSLRPLFFVTLCLRGEISIWIGQIALLSMAGSAQMRNFKKSAYTSPSPQRRNGLPRAHVLNQRHQCKQAERTARPDAVVTGARKVFGLKVAKCGLLLLGGLLRAGLGLGRLLRGLLGSCHNSGLLSHRDSGAFRGDSALDHRDTRIRWQPEIREWNAYQQVFHMDHIRVTTSVCPGLYVLSKKSSSATSSQSTSWPGRPARKPDLKRIRSCRKRSPVGHMATITALWTSEADRRTIDCSPPALIPSHRPRHSTDETPVFR